MADGASGASSPLVLAVVVEACEKDFVLAIIQSEYFLFFVFF
jgi:hypothetical protein